MSKEEALKLNSEIEKINNHLISLKKQRQKIELGDDFKNASENSKKLSLNLSGVLKKVAKWSLALIGIRSVYSGIRSVIGLVSQYNDQINTDFDYMRFAISKAFEPLAQWIVQALYKVLQLVNQISIEFFKLNLFENASVKNYKNMSKYAKDTAKSNSKSLTSMDEITNLNLDKGGTSGGISDDILPSGPDLSKVDETSQKYVEKMKKTSKTIFDFWEKDWETWFNNADGNWGSFFKGLLLTVEGFYKTFKGVFEIIGGVIDIFVGIFTGDTEKMQKGWDKMVNGLKDIIVGVIEIIVGLVLTLLGTIKGILLDLWDGIKAVCSTIGTWINDHVIKPVSKFFSGMWNGLKDGASNAWNGIKSVFGTVTSWFSNIFTKAWNAVKNVFSAGGKIFSGIKDGIFSAFKNVVNKLIDGINKVIKIPFNKLNSTLNDVRNTNILGKKPFKGLWGYNPISVPKIPKLAKGGIVNNPGRGVNMGSYIAGERGAEAVIPLQNSQFINDFAKLISSNMNNDLVVELLLELNRNILELSKKPTVLNINGKDLAQATYKDFQNESNRLNVSEFISIK